MEVLCDCVLLLKKDIISFSGLQKLLIVGGLSEKFKNGDFRNFSFNEINNLQSSKSQIWDFAAISGGICSFKNTLL
jgi:hypothetical protein